MQHIIKLDYINVHVETTSPEELQALFMIIEEMRICEITGYGTDTKISFINKTPIVESNTKYPIESAEE
jgi:hypothetical protein